MGDDVAVLVGEVRHAVGPEPSQRGIEHREFDVLPTRSTLSGEERRGDRLSDRVRCRLVSDERTDEIGERQRFAHLAVHHSSQTLDDRIEHRPLTVRTGRTEARDRGVDDLGVAGSCGGVIDSQSFDDTGSEVLDDDIGIGHQVQNDRKAVFGAGVDGEAAFPAIAVGVQATNVMHPENPSELTADRFDLDDVGPLISQDLCRQWTRHDLTEIEQTDSFKWSPHGGDVTPRRAVVLRTVVTG